MENFGSNPKFSLDNCRRRWPGANNILFKTIDFDSNRWYNKFKKERKGD